MEVERFDKNPSTVNDVYWIYSRDSIFKHHTDDHDGKWMMFFKLTDIDVRWNQACNLFRDGHLKGIKSIKVSTAKPNQESIFEPGEGIIIFYCGPSENEAKILEYGRNILKYMWYPRSHFFFKSDKPHLWSTRKYKHMYFIETGESELDLPDKLTANSNKTITKDGAPTTNVNVNPLKKANEANAVQNYNNFNYNYSISNLNNDFQNQNTIHNTDTNLNKHFY